MRTFFVLTSIAIVILCQLGCAPDGEQTKLENPIADDQTGFSAAPLLGDVVLENMYEDEARKLTDKTPVEIVTVLEGTSRVVLKAQFRGIRDRGFGFPLYECELMDEAAEAMGGIAAGMSGSPVGPPGRIMGALAYGENFARAPTRFWVTAIDAMEGTLDHQTLGGILANEAAPAAPGGGIHATYAPVKTPVVITGIQPHRLQQLSTQLTSLRYNAVELFAAIDGAPAAPPVGASAKLAAGDMIGVAIVEGDIVNSIGYGTVTQVYDDKFIAFGHPMFGEGMVALPVYRAVVNGLVSHLESTYKSASAYGNPIGTITKDLLPAIVGELGPPPPMIPVELSYHPANSPTPIVKHHRVAYGQESFIAFVAAGTTEALRMESSNATIEGTVSLEFQETDTVYTQSFRQTSASVFFDIAQNVGRIVRGFSDTLANGAGKATLKAVSITLTDKPQIARAAIAEVVAPEEILPGENVTVSITLVPHWSTAGAERTIQREVTLEIPEDFPAGEASINVSAGDSASGGDSVPMLPMLEAPMDFGDGAGGEEERPVPQNLDELIEQMAEDQVDPGLITVTLTLASPGGGFPPLGPEGHFPQENGEMPQDGEGEADFSLDGPPGPEDMEPPPTVEAELTLEGFVVMGSRRITVTITGEDMGDDTGEPADPDE